jgi:hypothetical protein
MLCFPESIKSAGGQITDCTVARHSEMVGLGRSLCRVFDENIAQRRTDSRKHGRVDRARDFLDLVKLLLKHELLTNIPGRYHTAYPDYVLTTDVSTPAQMHARIVKHKKKFSKRLQYVAGR